ncbi:MAG TPA: penicillin-binding transpeptidase domain-containing protein [Anaerolineaceae bacterium]
MFKWIRILLLAAILTACSGRVGPTTATPSLAPIPTSTLPNPQVVTTRVPDVKAATADFLKAWQADEYEKMYNMLTRASKDAVTLKDFTARYRDWAINISLQKLDFEVTSTLVNPSSAQAAYSVNYDTALVGAFTREMIMNLALENGAWKVRWEDGMIMPELRGGNKVVLDYKIPARGNIYDRGGEPLAAMAEAVSLGIIPGQIEEEKEGELLQILSRLTGRTIDAIRSLYKDAGANWYIAIGEASLNEVQAMYGNLTSFPGLVIGNFKARYYYGGGIAPQTVGYVLSIPKETLEDYRRAGYRGDEKVGMSGVEKWGEKYLMGKRGVSMYIVNAQGQIVTRLSQTEAESAQSIYTTIDRNLQIEAQKALLGFTGAAVVIERDTGRVLAMVSSPGFDQNLFEPTNKNSVILNQVLNDGTSRLMNRAAQGGGYPLGSAFKIITLAAALESGVYKPETTYNCGHTFTELPGITLYDWTYEKEKPPSGKLNLLEGLMRSCNPWFWHIGLELFQTGRTTAISEMARGFGLGSATGIQQIAEEAGNMPDPKNEGDAVNLAIGQGTMLVTPLQVASFTAAVGNGGTLYRPQVVDKITNLDGAAVYTFKPEVRNKLPISEENLKLVQKAMGLVTSDPRGTAYYVFTGLSVPVYGKTGTAQNPFGKPHAWFTGYTDAKRADKPDIAIAVIAENAGEGSEIAAPIFRRIVEVYYTGKPAKLYPWEAGKFNVTRTPTPKGMPSATPTPSK